MGKTTLNPSDARKKFFQLLEDDSGFKNIDEIHWDKI